MNTTRAPIGGRILRAAALAGLIQIAYVYIFAPFFGSRLGDFSRFAAAAIGVRPVGAGISWVGLAVLMAMALVWGAIYAMVRPRLPGAGWLAGALFGLGVWVVGTGLVVPLAAMWSAGTAIGFGGAPGLWGLGFGGASSTALSLTAHLAYGVSLGLLLGRREPAER